jgi:tetratricopeptide (TPR) repeat protein
MDSEELVENNQGNQIDLDSLSQLFSQAVQHYQRGDFHQASIDFKKLMIIDPNYADVIHLWGLSFYQIGQIDLGLKFIYRTLKINVFFGAGYSNLALIHKNLGRMNEAISLWHLAFIVEPNNSIFMANYAAALEETGQVHHALPISQHAVYSDPQITLVQNNLAVIQKIAGMMNEAALSNRRSIILQPDYSFSYGNLTNIREQQNQLEEAIQLGQRSILLKPDNSDAHVNLAVALLAHGRLSEGWQAFEWRWLSHDMNKARRDYPSPPWKGEEGNGRALLLYAEQGLGDCLHFCRYALIAAQRNWKIILEVPPLLKRIVQTMDPNFQVIAQGEPLPDFEAHCALMSLPLVTGYGMSLETIPHYVSYLSPYEDDILLWRKRIEDFEQGDRRFRIGLVWAGNPSLAKEYYLPHRHNARDQRRSLPPHNLVPLLQNDSVRFFSVQKNGPALSQPHNVVDFMSDIHDFADCAAFIYHLDLIISVDTSVVHLASAIGKPVWMMDRFDSCWRWLRDRNDSPWYPQLRLFRQKTPGDWQGVITEIQDSLQEKLQPKLILDSDLEDIRIKADDQSLYHESFHNPLDLTKSTFIQWIKKIILWSPWP